MGEATDPGAVVSAEELRKPLYHYQRGQSPRRKCNAVLIYSVYVKICAGSDSEEARGVTQHKEVLFGGGFCFGSVEN